MKATTVCKVLRLVIGWIVLAAPLLAVHAHEGGATAFARITQSGQTVRYILSIPDVASQSFAAASRNARPEADFSDALARAVRERVQLAGDETACAAGPAQVAPPSANSVSLTVTIDFACPPMMRFFSIRDDSFDVLGGDMHILARIELDGATAQLAFATEKREARIPLDSTPRPARGVGSFFALGIEHIVTGYDHLLFLLALMIGGGALWSLFVIVTSFTLAHSITLTVAALEWVVLPSRLVESAIALSIVYVAIENIFLRDRAVSKRWLVALVFGLVHGFGFSAGLKELGLPTDGLVWPLLLFNLGVEAGQVLVILAAVPVLIGLQRAPWRPRLSGWFRWRCLRSAWCWSSNERSSRRAQVRIQRRVLTRRSCSLRADCCPCPRELPSRRTQASRSCRMHDR